MTNAAWIRAAIYVAISIPVSIVAFTIIFGVLAMGWVGLLVVAAAAVLFIVFVIARNGWKSGCLWSLVAIPLLTFIGLIYVGVTYGAHR